METLTLGVDGMTCGGCVVSVEKAVARLKGVHTVRVSLERKEVAIDGEALDRATLAAAIYEAGYDIRE